MLLQRPLGTHGDWKKCEPGEGGLARKTGEGGGEGGVRRNGLWCRAFVEWDGKWAPKDGRA